MKVQTHNRADTSRINTFWEWAGGGLPGSMGGRKRSGFIIPKQYGLFKVLRFVCCDQAVRKVPGLIYLTHGNESRKKVVLRNQNACDFLSKQETLI